MSDIGRDVRDLRKSGVAGTGFLTLSPRSAADLRLVVLHEPESFAAAQYQALRHVVERARETRGVRVVVVTSPAPGDGKTLTAINLSLALARASERRVLLIDADFRRPSVFTSLGLSSRRLGGLAQTSTTGSASLLDVTRYCPDYRLFLIPAGESHLPPYDILASSALARLLEEARQQFDCTVIDTPPTVGFPDYRLLEKHGDGSFIVVAAGITPRRMVEMALDTVDHKKALGLVLNRAEVSSVASYYQKYHARHPRSVRP